MKLVSFPIISLGCAAVIGTLDFAASRPASAEVILHNGNLLYEFGAYGLDGRPVVRTLGAGNVVQNNVLLAPGRAFPALATPLSPAPFQSSPPSGVGLPFATAATDSHGNAAGLFVKPVETHSFNGLGEMGGFNWVGSFVAASTMVTNASEATGTFTITPFNGGTSISLPTGVGFGVEGFVPTGGYAAVAMAGTISDANGNVIDNFTTNTGPGPAEVVVEGNGNDVAEGSGQATDSSGGLDPLATSYTGLQETAVAGGIDFLAYAVSVGPTNVIPGNDYTVDITLTMSADPGASMQLIDPTSLNPNLVIPDFGGFSMSVPEPGPISLIAPGVLTLVIRRFRRRSTHLG